MEDVRGSFCDVLVCEAYSSNALGPEQGKQGMRVAEEIAELNACSHYLFLSFSLSLLSLFLLFLSFSLSLFLSFSLSLFLSFSSFLSFLSFFFLSFSLSLFLSFSLSLFSLSSLFLFFSLSPLSLFPLFLSFSLSLFLSFLSFSLSLFLSFSLSLSLSLFLFLVKLHASLPAFVLHVCSLLQALSSLHCMSQKVGSCRLHWLTVCLNTTPLALVSKSSNRF